MTRSRLIIAGMAAMAVLAALPLAAQRGGRGRGRPLANGGEEYRGGFMPNMPYDGRFTFVRISYNREEYSWARGPSQRVYWSHDYPRAETHFMKIMSELTALRPYMGGGNILALDDPALFKYPLAYLCEPGSWRATDAEAEGLRNYLLKGGFLIIDDFGRDQWYNFEDQIRKVLPKARILPVDVSHPIFDSFFKIKLLSMLERGYRGQPVYLGIYEDNDPAKRLMMIINFQNDIGEYWEWSDTNQFAVEPSHEAYKLGVNYLMYGLTH